jgi:hypothetical protein
MGFPGLSLDLFRKEQALPGWDFTMLLLAPCKDLKNEGGLKKVRFGWLKLTSLLVLSFPRRTPESERRLDRSVGYGFLAFVWDLCLNTHCFLKSKTDFTWVPAVVHSCNPSYSGSRNQ